MAERKGKERVVEKIKREFAAGGVVFRGVGEETLWLVTKSAPSEAYPDSVWRLPKGWLDDENDGRSPGPLTRGEKMATEEELREAALREVREEGGVEAEIIGKVGTERLFLNTNRGRILKFITFYLMEWEKDLEEGFGFETSEVNWLPFGKARERLTFSSEKKVLDKARDLLNRPIQPGLI